MFPTPQTTRRSKSVTDLTGPAQNTRSHSSFKISDQPSISGFYQESEADHDKEEQTPQPKSRAKGKGKAVHSSFTIDLSLHPYYTTSSSRNPIPIVNNLEDLVRVLTHITDEPKWYKFIRNMIAFDISNFDQYAEMESQNARLATKVNTLKASIRVYQDQQEKVNRDLQDSEERYLDLQYQLNLSKQRNQDLLKAQQRTPVPSPIPPRPPVAPAPASHISSQNSLSTTQLFVTFTEPVNAEPSRNFVSPTVAAQPDIPFASQVTPIK